MIKLKAAELRNTVPLEKHKKLLKKHELYIVLDNVMDTYNVGAIFRLADALSAKKVILCGQTETPPNTRIKKASINTTEWVDWQYFANIKSAIDHLRSTIDHIQIVAIEQDKRSTPYDHFRYQFPLALVVGHETIGVSKDVLKLSDAIVELPMQGVNVSLNVMVSLGIVLFETMKHV